MLNTRIRNIEYADRIRAGQNENTLYLPFSSNYCAIDAWIPGVGAFQMTVSKKHNINRPEQLIQDLDLLGRNSQKLYWILQPESFYTFKKQTPISIDQFALKIPHPPVIKDT